MLPAFFMAAMAFVGPVAHAKTLHPAVRLLRGQVQVFGDWIVGCDNAQVCTAVVPLEAGPQLGETAYVRMIFTAAIADPQSVTFVASTGEEESLSPLAAHRLMEQLTAGDAGQAIHHRDGGAGQPISRSGFRPMIRTLASWRKTARQREAAMPAVAPVPLPRWAVRAVPSAIARAEEHCPQGHIGASIQAWGVAGGPILWRAGCGDEGLNPVSAWYLQRSPDGVPQRAVFDDLGLSVAAYNSWYEESSGLLYMTHYFGGQFSTGFEDCGVYRAYAWTGDRLVLVEKRAMPVCGHGLMTEDWITTYRSLRVPPPAAR